MICSRRKSVRLFCLTALALFCVQIPNALCAAAPKPAPPPLPSLEASAEGRAVLAALEKAQYKFTPEVRGAYLSFAKAQALADLKAAGKTLPEDFLAWVSSDPAIESTVYGARMKSSDVLLMLRSLEIDLGTDAVRKKYTQLALAMAIVHAADGAQANLAPRELLKVTIPGDPRKPVDTKDPNRTLDMNDHIINFLNDHAPIEEEVVVGHKDEVPELKYDDKGVAIPASKGKPKKVPIVEKRARPLIAADVLASKALQDEFNAYMKAKGQNVEIHCGDHIIFRDRHDAVHEPEGKEILKAYQLFRAAYEAKGLLPAARDPFPTPAEKCAYLIRNNEYAFAPELKREWPRFPLNAPWPLLTLLAANDQPVREREDIWIRYRDKGEMRTYGEYIGGIAQQFDFQSARRLSPLAFTYGTIQMMLKDGGVCGTMANIGVRTFVTLGIPACTAGQPGHCALIHFAQDKKTQAWECRGGQFATGGPKETHPHTPWFFGVVDARRDMIYHQTIAWAVNYGLQPYVDSTIAYQINRLLPVAVKSRGLDVLESGLSLNPYNVLLADAGVETAKDAPSEIRFWKAYKSAQAAKTAKPGCPSDALYEATVRESFFRALTKMPVPEMKSAREVYAFLKAENCDNPDVVAAYQSFVEGMPALLAHTTADLRAHVTSVRTDESCAIMSGAVQAAARLITDKKQRAQWVAERWQDIDGHEYYFNHKNLVATDPTAAALAKLAGRKLRPENEMLTALLDQTIARLKSSIDGEREPKGCQQLAAQIAACGEQIKDAAQRRQWGERLSKLIAGHEEFVPKSAKRGKAHRDPCADAVAKLLAPAA